jgi:hypothetical protein
MNTPGRFFALSLSLRICAEVTAMNLICLLYIKTPQAVAFYRQHEVLYHSLFADVYIVTMSIRRSSHKLSQINEHQLQRGDQCPGFVLAGDIEVFLVSKTLALTFFLAYVAGLLA